MNGVRQKIYICFWRDWRGWWQHCSLNHTKKLNKSPPPLETWHVISKATHLNLSQGYRSLVLHHLTLNLNLTFFAACLFLTASFKSVPNWQCKLNSATCMNGTPSNWSCLRMSVLRGIPRHKIRRQLNLRSKAMHVIWKEDIFNYSETCLKRTRSIVVTCLKRKEDFSFLVRVSRNLPRADTCLKRTTV